SCHTSHSGLSPYAGWEPTHKPLDTLNRLFSMPEKHPQREAETLHTPSNLTHGVDNLYRNTPHKNENHTMTIFIVSGCGVCTYKYTDLQLDDKWIHANHVKD
ncbi:hypothetical protein ABRP87_11100, partial [Corynebacterium sp. KPL2830]|uniref:hypothetical protein n=1 Tax=Corynebacterium sp. KPL2830 TaxID=3158315 RepID=UPI0032EBC5B8